MYDRIAFSKNILFTVIKNTDKKHSINKKVFNIFEKFQPDKNVIIRYFSLRFSTYFLFKL